ncbi:MAG: hypothetical protein EG825_12425 [Rhodocyclaceae bacterium]|nr:hypothetical protein [Rhodocyclaceae bacterium]
MKKLLLAMCVEFLSSYVYAGFLDDAACGLDSLLGGNCEEVRAYNSEVRDYNRKAAEINTYEKESQERWMNGEMTAIEMLKQVYEYHNMQIGISADAREYYLYAAQVAKACDAGTLEKEKGLYSIIKKDNEISERVRTRRDREATRNAAERAATNTGRSRTCTTRRWGNELHTYCY